MINQLGAYADAGKATAKARNEKDETRAMFERDYFNRMVSFEHPDIKPIARTAFDDAYKKERKL